MIIPIIFATDNNYVPYCGVAITSLIENANSKNKYDVFVMYEKLPVASIYRLESLSSNSISVKCVCVKHYVKNLIVKKEYNHLTVASAYRLIIPDVFPQYDKVLYLDSDIVVNADVADLYKYDVHDYILGAVSGYYKSDDDDFMYNHITKDLGISIENFFNAGILIINCVNFKKHDVKDKCFKLLGSRTDLYFMDQCAMNIVCAGMVCFVPKIWNFEWQFLFTSTMSSKEQELLAVIKENSKQAIIHFSGIEKPWDYPEQILAFYFWKYARQSIFYEEILNLNQAKKSKEIFKVFSLLNEFRKVAVYGAGNNGKKYVKRILEANICDIVVWVDRNYQNLDSTILPVSSIDKIFETDFDRLVITIANKKISDDVKDMLVAKGVEEKKILQVC